MALHTAKVPRTADGAARRSLLAPRERRASDVQIGCKENAEKLKRTERNIRNIKKRKATEIASAACRPKHFTMIHNMPTLAADVCCRSPLPPPVVRFVADARHRVRYRRQYRRIEVYCRVWAAERAKAAWQ